MRHTHFADIRAAAAALAEKTGASLGFLPEGGNAVGLALAGVLPHRLPGGRRFQAGSGRRPHARIAARRLRAAGRNRARQGHRASRSRTGAGRLPARHRDHAVRRSGRHEHCPACCCRWAAFAETSGSYVNVEGRWQEFRAARSRSGRRARAGRSCVCSATCSGSMDSTTRVPRTCSRSCANLRRRRLRREVSGAARIQAERRGSTTSVPLYGADALVRRAPALQRTRARAGRLSRAVLLRGLVRFQRAGRLGDIPRHRTDRRGPHLDRASRSRC